MPVTTVREGDLGPRERIGSGGQAAVFRVPQARLPGVRTPLVYKRYRGAWLEGRQAALLHGLARIMDLREITADRRLDACSVWPLAVVVQDDDATQACGVLMRQLPPACFIELSLLASRTTRVWEAVQLLQPDESLAARGLPVWTDLQRHEFLARLIDFLALLHRHHVIVGDLSARNVAIRRDRDIARGYHPMLVDVDTCRVVGEGSPLPQAHTPDWEPPESLAAMQQLQDAIGRRAARTELARLAALSNVQNTASDVYKVALFALRLFHVGGDHTMVRRSETGERRLTEALGPRRARVVLAGLSDDPAARPTMLRMADAVTGRRL